MFGRNEKQIGRWRSFRKETNNNNYVGKKKETHNIVGLGGVGFWIDLKLFHAIRNYSLRGLKKSGRFGHIASGVL